MFLCLRKNKFFLITHIRCIIILPLYCFSNLCLLTLSESLDRENNPQLMYITLGIWTWSMLQFPLHLSGRLSHASRTLCPLRYYILCKGPASVLVAHLLAFCCYQHSLVLDCNELPHVTALLTQN